MRHPTKYFLSLDDVPLDLVDVDDDDECYGAGLYCPDDPLDKLGNYVDDVLLESIGCSPPRAAPASGCPVAGVGDGAVDIYVDDVPGFSRTVRGGGPETCAALTGRLVPQNVPPLPAEALPCSMPSPSLEAQSVEPAASPFNPSTVPRKRRCLVTVRKQSWNLALPTVFLAAAAHPKHGDHHYNNGNSARKVSRGNGGGGHRRSAGRQRNRQVHRRCAHCSVEETPQWRAGPDGAGTLCNACGIRYSLGKDKLVPEYRPSTSPSFRSDEHSNRNRKVELIREKKGRSLKVDGDKDHTGGDEFLRWCTYR